MKLVVLEPLGVGEEMIKKLAKNTLPEDIKITCFDTRAEDAATLIDRSKDADIVVLTNFPYRREVMEHCPNLKLICVAFTGFDHVDMEYCRGRGITVCNCAGYSTTAVADLTFGLVISLLRKLSAADAAARAGGTKNGLLGTELEGKIFGVVGTGAIGIRVAKIAQAFGCEVLAYSRTVKNVDGIQYTDLDTLLSTSDIVSLHLPQNASTVGLISREKIALMKKTALLINTARGPIVDNKALADALNAGEIGGAGIDVFDMEPPLPTDYPLLGAPNTALAPHIGFVTHEAMEKRALIVFGNIAKWLMGKPQNTVS